MDDTQTMEAPPDQIADTSEMAAPSDVCFDPAANLGPVDMKPDRFGNVKSQDERREQVVAKAMDKFRQYREHPLRKAAEERWSLEYKLIMRWKETTNPDEVVLGEIWRERETMVTQFKWWTSFEGQYKARMPGGEKMAAAATAIAKDQLQRFGSKSEARMAIENMVDHGVGYLSPVWSRFKRVSTKIDDFHAGDGSGAIWDKETTEIIENGPQLKHIHPKYMFTNPYTREVKNSDAVFVPEGMSPSGMKTMVRAGYYDAAATQACIEAKHATYSDNDYGYDIGTGDDDLLIHGGDDALHEVVTVWANGYELVIADQEFLLRCAKLPQGKIPVITLGLYQMDGEHYGEGLPSKLASLQRVVNQLVTYKVSQTAFMAHPPLLLKNGTTAERNYKNLKLRPGATLGVDDITHAKYLEFPAGAIETCDQGIGFFQNAQKNETGINDRFSGQGENSGTATLGMSLIKAATDRIQYKVDCLMPQGMECFEWFYNLNARHLDHLYAVRVAGRDGVEYMEHYPPTVFAPDVDQEVVLGSPSGPEQVNMWTGVVKTISGVPGIDPLWLADQLLIATGKTANEIASAHVSGPNAQGDALAEVKQLFETGLIPEAKPSDNHQVHVEVKSMAMQMPQFMALPPQWQMALQGNVATHAAFLQQQQAAAAQQSQMALTQQGGGDGPGGGESAVNKKANDKANGMFNMGATGAQQLGAA